jgi:hypothetical protein
LRWSLQSFFYRLLFFFFFFFCMKLFSQALNLHGFSMKNLTLTLCKKQVSLFIFLKLLAITRRLSRAILSIVALAYHLHTHTFFYQV